MTHKQLVKRIASWYKMRRQSSVILTEFVTAAQEIPDIIVFESGANTTLIECKVSRADFLSDKDKLFRRQEQYGMGDRRYYATPPGLIKPEELPEGWGLLEVHERQINTIAVSVHKPADKRRECMMLMSALRRLEISTAVFVIQGDDDDGQSDK